MSTKTAKAAAADEQNALDLFPPVADEKIGATRKVVVLDITTIEPDPDQPRKDADDELKESIRVDGVLQPITVRPNPDPENRASGIAWRIKFGERRYWGSIKAGRPSIPAIIDETTDEDEARRLVRQWAENRHKRLDPVNEGAFFVRMRQLMPKASINELAKLLDVPKSTFNDRMAMAEAPAPFQKLFEQGSLTAAAGPVVRKYSEIPTELLEKGVKAACGYWQWSSAIREGKAIPLNQVEHVLSDVLLRGMLREIPNKLALAYQGPKVVIGKTEYATDVDAFIKVERKQFEQEQREAAEKAKKSGKSPSKKTPAKATAPKLTPAQIKAREKERKETEKREAENLRWKLAAPAIRSAVVAAIKKGSTGPIADALLEGMLPGFTLFSDLYLSKDDIKAADKAGLPRGKTADDFLRHLAYALLNVSLSDLESIGGGGMQADTISRAVKELELKVDLKKLLADVKLAEPKAEQAAAKKGKGK